MRAASQPSETAARALRAILCLVLVSAVAACASSHRGGRYGGARNYTSPGPPEDPWGPYIREAAGRFQVPETWVREVMRQAIRRQAVSRRRSHHLLGRRDGPDAGDAGHL